MTAPDPDQILADEAAFRELHGTPSGGAVAKVIDHVDAHARAFLERSPFLLAATRGAGGADCSPRGDAPGFVRVLDETTLLIPDRPGNRRADTLLNVIDDPEIALLALIPGMNETLRVNGRAWVVHDPELLASSAVNGKVPKVALWIHVEEVYMHCPKAFVRSRLWDPARHMDRAAFPSLGRIILDQIKATTHAEDDPDVAAVDVALETDTRENLY